MKEVSINLFIVSQEMHSNNLFLKRLNLLGLLPLSYGIVFNHPCPLHLLV